MDNLKVTTATRPAWTDHSLAVVGGLMYVTLPTAIEAGFGVDLTGWRGFLTSVAVNLLLGGVFQSPAYMAGTLGAAAAHLTYAKLQDRVFVRYLRKYAYRFDPTIVTSNMSDDAPTLPSGTVLRTVAGEQIAAFPPSPTAASVGIAQPISMIQQPIAMNQQPMATNQNMPTLTDGYGRTLSAPHLADQYTPKRARVRARYNQPFNAGWTHGMT